MATAAAADEAPPNDGRSAEDADDDAPYRDEVLGRTVRIQFQNGDGSRKFYSGVITEVRIALLDKTYVEMGVAIRHYVEFEDGDQLWFDLVQEEVEGRLRWP